eukprot:EG_transcript_92
MSVIYPFPHSSAPLKEAVAVQFAIFNPEEIKKGSVARVESQDTYINGVPKKGGLQDPATGTCDPTSRCLSCHQNKNECPGHFSYIELAQPMFHVGYLNVVLKVLKCVCYRCSKLLVDERDEKFRQALKISSPFARLRTIVKLCENKSVCEATELERGADEDPLDTLPADGVRGHGGCGELQPKIHREHGTFKLWAEFKQTNIDERSSERKELVTAQQVHAMLKNIPEEDIVRMGFDPRHSRPEWMILTVFPVPPPPVRPAVVMGSAQRSDDDLTHKLKDIVKANNALLRQEANGAPQHIINEFAQLLQFHCATFVDNELGGFPKATLRSGRPIKSIRERLKGKAGRVRQNLMGKRVDFSARTVITADPNLELDQVGVPISVARILTFPERVTVYNIDQMYELVRRGPNQWPGAKFYLRDDGQRVNLQFVKKTSDVHLEPGYIVERHLNDGDCVLFNRQPTLHRMSMMGHRAKVLPYSTFRLNLSVTTPYNADFDGDEMNLHLPQSLLTRSELVHMMLVPKNIITPQASRPCMGIVQDSLLGCNRLTKRDTFLDQALMMNVLMHVPSFERVPVPAIVKCPAGPLWTGKQLFSEVIPPVNRTGYANEHPDREQDKDLSVMDTKVVIKQGELIMGICDKKAVGNGAGSLVHIIFNEFGPDRCKWFLTNVQRIVNHWLVHVSFSVGCGDTIADEKTVIQITDIIDKCKGQVKNILKSAQEGTLKCQPGKTVQETFEKDVNGVLNKAREDAGKAALNSLRRSNRFKIMVAAGSKGSPLNISQIAACVGQQNVEGKRIPFGFRRRSLPHFTQDDHGPESRGFVENCYLRGLTPQEMFFHAMGGREGLIDTAVKTAETGYIQRKLIKALEDVKAEYDGTCRDSTNRVIQWVYGEDGFDGMRLEDQKFELLKMSNKDMDKIYKYASPDKLDFGGDWMDREIKDDFIENPTKYEMLEQEFDKLLEDRKYLREWAMENGEDKRPLPVNLDRLIENAQSFFSITRSNVSDLHPCDVIQSVKDLEKELLIVRGPNARQRQECATRLFHLFLRQRLASKRVLKEYRLDSQALNWLLGEIRLKFDAAQVNPGEMVGSIAAQSCGEPATQMTLNTFHFAGVSSKNVTLGVPRLRELINIAKRPKQQGLNIFLEAGINNDMEKAKRVLTRIEFTTLRHVTTLVEIIYDPNPADTVVEEDKQLVGIFFDWELLTEEEKEDMRKKIERMSPWLMRIEFDSSIMFDKEIEMTEIQQKLREKFKDNIWIEISDDNAEKLVMRLRIMDQDVRRGDEEEDSMEDDGVIDTLKQLEQEILDNLTLRGVAGIKKCTMKQNKVQVYDPDTGEARREEPWALETDGTNLLAVLACEDVDATRTIGNSICEITQVLGIEAVRNALYKEIKFVYDVYGINIGYRHYSVLCDVMTNKGYLMAISRHGINRQTCGPLMRCSYEETVEILFQAAAFGERDPMKGVSANILMGKPIKGGTGAFDLLLDSDMLKTENAQPQRAAAIRADDSHATSSGRSPGMQSMRRSEAGGLSPRTEFGGGAYSPYAATSNAGLSPISLGGAFDSPIGAFSPLHRPSGAAGFSPGLSPAMSPAMFSDAAASPAFSALSPASPSYTPASPSASPASPSYSPISPSYSPISPAYSPMSPSYSPLSPSYSPLSPSYSPQPSAAGAGGASGPHFTPHSAASGAIPAGYSPSASSGGKVFSPVGPAGQAGPLSPSYSPASPAFSPVASSYTMGSSGLSTSPAYSPESPSYSPASQSYSPSSATDRTPSNLSDGGWSPSLFSGQSPHTPSSAGVGGSPASPIYSPASPSSPSLPYSAASPAYSPASPAYSPASPAYSPASPAFQPASPAYSPASPAYSPASPAYSPASPAYSPASPAYSPASPAYSPASPAYSPTSVKGSQAYSPASPAYSPATSGAVAAAYSPASPQYSPASPQYSPASPQYSVASPAYSPASPKYSPTSPQYSAPSPQYSPASPKYSPGSPAYSFPSPKYTPVSPQYSAASQSSRSASSLAASGSQGDASSAFSPPSPNYSPASPQYSPASPQYSPGPQSSAFSPQYSPASPKYSPASPLYTAPSPKYSPQSPAYSPSSPKYTPITSALLSDPHTSPTYSPTLPAAPKPVVVKQEPAEEDIGGLSPIYSPRSPVYTPATSTGPRSPSKPPGDSSPAGAEDSAMYSPVLPSGDFPSPASEQGHGENSPNQPTS